MQKSPEGRDPWCRRSSAELWIPAFAGVTRRYCPDLRGRSAKNFLQDQAEQGDLGTEYAARASTTDDGSSVSCRGNRAGTMKALVGLYLSIGTVLLLIGFFATGPCPD